jgi:hypothetical protein
MAAPKIPKTGGWANAAPAKNNKGVFKATRASGGGKSQGFGGKSVAKGGSGPGNPFNPDSARARGQRRDRKGRFA